MFGKDKIDNYHPDFLIRLTNFANKLDYDMLIRTNPDFLIGLAQRWPSKLNKN